MIRSMASLLPTISVIATTLLVGLALATLILNGQSRLERRLMALENRLVAVGKEIARIGGLLEGLGFDGRAKAPDSD